MGTNKLDYLDVLLNKFSRYDECRKLVEEIYFIVLSRVGYDHGTYDRTTQIPTNISNLQELIDWATDTIYDSITSPEISQEIDQLESKVNNWIYKHGDTYNDYYRCVSQNNGYMHDFELYPLMTSNNEYKSECDLYVEYHYDYNENTKTCTPNYDKETYLHYNEYVDDYKWKLLTKICPSYRPEHPDNRDIIENKLEEFLVKNIPKLDYILTKFKKQSDKYLKFERRYQAEK